MISPRSIRLALAVVPPMSKEMMFCQTALAPHERRRDHARRRSRLHRHRRHAQALAHAEDAAARAHHPRRRQSHAGDGRLETAEVGRKDRPHVRAHGRGAGALELADLRQHLARQEDRQVGERRPQRSARSPRSWASLRNENSRQTAMASIRCRRMNSTAASTSLGVERPLPPAPGRRRARGPPVAGDGAPARPGRPGRDRRGSRGPSAAARARRDSRAW